MPELGSRGRALGQALLLPAGVLAVHQLRYTLAFGGHAGVELARSGHAYLHSLAPWLVLLAGLAAGGWLRSLGRAYAGHTALPRYTTSLARLWLVTSLALVGLFAAQELLEGTFATGHAPGLAAVLALGGWWAIPVALVVGLVIAVALHGARWAVTALARRRASRPLALATARPARPPRPPRTAVPAPLPLAAGWSLRGPPA